MSSAISVLVGSVVLSLVLAVSGEELNECNPKACQKADNEKAVCGSDGLSYPSRCQLERVRCQNQNVTVIKRGLCKQQRPCLEWDLISSETPQYKFKPKCKQNGTYEAGQCHPETGYCWCVTPEGIPIPYTTKKINDKPGSKPIRCRSRRKKTRSPIGSTKRNVCKINEKSLFNRNLISSFHSEYQREIERKVDVKDEMVIAWKFQTLDLNVDRVLDKAEYKDIKRLVKKAMKPKKCAKAFPKSCDINNDAKITLEEWSDCFDKSGKTDGKQSSSTDGEDDEDIEDFANRHQPPLHGVLSENSAPLPLNQNYDDESMENREEDVTDCISDRKMALEEAKDPNHDPIYIPECTPDGRYQKVQCYRSAGYCWCVNEDTGKNIPGTSIKDNIPNCNLLKITQHPMKGCADDKKIIFLKELLQFLHNKMTESVSINNPAGTLALLQSRDEQAAHWSFNYFDKDRNKVLDRPEWKAFKEYVSPIKTLRKCGKKLPKYCDSNKDREISRTEWLDCLNIQEQQASAFPSPRTGKKNPLDVLKDD
ncbi:SPARC related modular calcium binding-like protein magu isoform X2 [Rhynchophorus ferrugineus]|uniref:SPARC related modular calcium binding-like protein magu isoform X2 n=1 Tax=Rhynchophorus ferrugineus TaxID=354439 RepID=UPI003FCCCEA9